MRTAGGRRAPAAPAPDVPDVGRVLLLRTEHDWEDLVELPVRRGGDHPAEREFARLRDAFAEQLEHWQDFVRTFPEAVHDALPLVDVEETDDAFVLEVELPGVRREDVDLEVDAGRLRLIAERRERRRVGLLRHRTRTTGRFSLDVALPVPVDSSAVSASLDSGLLTVVVPKAERVRRRRIPVASRP